MEFVFNYQTYILLRILCYLVSIPIFEVAELKEPHEKKLSLHSGYTAVQYSRNYVTLIILFIRNVIDSNTVNI